MIRSLMVKHSCGFNQKHVLSLHLIQYQNTIFGVVMLNHIYLPFALGMFLNNLYVYPVIVTKFFAKITV